MKSHTKLSRNQKGVAHWIVPILVIAVVAAVGVKLYIDTHAASALLPNWHPASNVTPNPNYVSYSYCAGGYNNNSSTCVNAIQQATSVARSSTEGLGALMNATQLANYEGMSIPEQQFVLANLERLSVGLPVIAAMTNQLDTVAQVGANAGTDPTVSLPYTLTSGAQSHSYAANWCGNWNAYACNFSYMYADSGSGWQHRFNVLNAQASSGCGEYMGAAYANQGTGMTGSRVSYGEIFVQDCGAAPADVTLTWAQASASLNQARTTAVSSVGSIPAADGYLAVSSDGNVYAYGPQGRNYGSMYGHPLNKPIVGIAEDNTTHGYFMAASDGGLFDFNAPFYGSLGNIALNKPIVGVASTGAGNGYWFVASDGGIFQKGAAPFYGSLGNIKLNQPVVGMARSGAGNGYWLVASDGGVFQFNAGFFGSTGNIHLNQPVVGIASTADGKGYWLVAKDGGIFNFGDAPFYGSVPGEHYTETDIVGITRLQDGGYSMVGSDGSSFWFAPSSHGSTAPRSHTAPIVGVTTN